MLRWVVKTLWSQKTSVIVSSSGVAAAFVLVVILDAAFVGESNQIVSYVRNANPDVWVMQKGVSNMHMATTFVWDWKADRIAEIPGVKKATPILYVNTIVHVGQQKLFAYLMGLKANGQRAGPWSIAAGKSHPARGEIILPYVLVKTAGVKLGDQAIVADTTFTIVGFSKETFSMANSIAFVHFKDLEDLIDMNGNISFILVDIDDDQKPEEMALRIEQEVDKVSAIPQKIFIENDFQIALLMGVEIISFMTIIGSILAALIIAFTMYSQVSKRRRELAIIKALGYKNASLYFAVVFQSVIITGLALLIALGITWGLLPLLSAVSPMVTLDVTADALTRMTFIAGFIAIVSALIPAHYVARVDPQTAFKI